jgi:two-component sensor histidine kinase
VVNELITNAFKHAFPGGRSGQITVRLCHEVGGGVLVSVSDDGVGIPEGLDIAKTESLGLQLVTVLTDQLGAELTIRRANPTRFELRLPKQA